jgi:hypothetical protein
MALDTAVHIIHPCHARESGHPVTRTGAIKAEAEPFIQCGDYWIVRFRGR